MDSVEIQFKDGTALGIGSFPIGKRPRLYIKDNNTYTSLAVFKDEEAAIKAMRFLEQIKHAYLFPTSYSFKSRRNS